MYQTIRAFHTITGATLEEFYRTDMKTINTFIEMYDLENKISNQVQERKNNATSKSQR